MITLLDLRPQAPSLPNGPTQNAGSDGDAFADLFAEADKADASSEDVVPGAWALPGVPTGQSPRVGQVISGTDTSCPDADALAVVDHDPTGPRAHPPTIDPAAGEGAEMSRLPAQQTPFGDSPSELPPGAAKEPVVILESGSNTAEISRSADPGRRAANVQKPGGKGSGTPQMAAGNTPHPTPGNLAAVGQSRMVHDMGPDTVPQPTARPRTGAQVQVTVVPAMVPLVFQQALAQPMGALPALSVQDRDPGVDDVADTAVTATKQAVAREIPVKGAARPGNGQAEPAWPPDGMDMASGEHVERGPTAAPGPHFPTQATGPTASVAPLTAGSVAAAVAAAIPPANTPADRVEVILSPEELGRVQMDFRADGDGMRVFLTAERPETLDLLRRHADQLASELRQAGYSGASLSFGQWGQPQDKGRHGGHHTAIPQAESHIATPSPATSPRNMSGRGLDLRI